MDKELRQKINASWQTMLDAAQEALRDKSEGWTPDALIALENIVCICQEQLKDKTE